MEDERETLLTRAARALATDPRVIASALTVYQSRMALDQAALAAWLGLTVTGLHGLALCRKPVSDDPDYAQAVRAIARHVGCDPERLFLVLDAEEWAGQN